MSKQLIIGTIVVAVAFGLLWYFKQLERISSYIGETKEELKRCNWPAWTQLKGSTLLVCICMIVLAAFTATADFVFAYLVQILT